MFGKRLDHWSILDFLASGEEEAFEAGELGKSQLSNDLAEHVKEFGLIWIGGDCRGLQRV